MAPGRVVLAVAVLVTAAQLVVGIARAEAPDPRAVEAYIGQIESLFQESVAIGDRIYGSRRAVDDFNRGRIDGAELTRILGPVFDGLHGDLTAHRSRVLNNLRPPPTGDPERNHRLLTVTMAVPLMSDLLLSMLTAADNLRLSAARHDDAGYHRAETDMLDLRATVYSIRHAFLGGRFIELDSDDPAHGIYLVGMGINGAGEKNFRYLTKSTRTDSFDPAAYISSIEHSLGRIEKGVARGETAMADSSQPSVAPTGDAEAEARRQRLSIDLSRQYFAGAREFTAAIRRSLDALRAAAAGKDKLSGREMHEPVHRLRLDIERALADAAELDQIRFDLVDLLERPRAG